MGSYSSYTPGCLQNVSPQGTQAEKDSDLQNEGLCVVGWTKRHLYTTKHKHVFLRFRVFILSTSTLWIHYVNLAGKALIL